MAKNQVDENDVLEVRCPRCGFIFQYKMGNIAYDASNPLGFVSCPACGEHVQTSLGYVKEDN